VTIRTVLLTASALILADACNPSATDAPAPAPAPTAPIADPATPAPSGPAAENTTDSLASTPAAPAAPVTVAPGGVTVGDSPTLEQLAAAKTAYASTCAMCHGPTGQGTQMGVSLVNGLEIAVIKEKVTKGMINPGDKMPPMGAAMSADTLDALAKFIAAGLPQ
jgi:mono/diheme cytochrome c family protein